MISEGKFAIRLTGDLQNANRLPGKVTWIAKVGRIFFYP
ncbi:hypothetical protein BN137_397 [Cronobacter condimenti 1330]|uniref:Uncharacterized protein n=1 Tax=Cronobacter condimenti 1330 TaxID=1073999 RepID=K8A9W7_9ENTR|nr:hypothetical protein BN137_397 [Cronobacter condimenti 1330]